MATTRRRFFAALLSSMLLILGLGGIGTELAQGLDPASVEATIFPCESTTVNKTVHTPAIPPQPDIMFLSDTTGSMGDAIANEVAEKVLALPRVAEVNVDMVFDPPWTRYHMSEAARLTLGL